MKKVTKEMQIKIVKDGPYLVSGGIPLFEKILVSKDGLQEYEEVRELPQAEEYSLCRCGQSKNAPFCDGSHVECQFNGAETASKEDYADRVINYEGPELDLLDDDRCAFARFCHQHHGSAWDLVEQSDDEVCREEAILAASNCPSGRLTAVNKEGLIEPELEPAIYIVQDPNKKASAGIFVRGYIPICDDKGELYEVRNRIALCRCGKSRNKPFCDATHVPIRFKDK